MSESSRTPFIPAWLDDAGLSPLAFRVLCRIFRRGKFYESKSKLEREFKVGNRSLAAAFQELVSGGFIIETTAVGKPSTYRPSANQHRVSSADPVPPSTTPQCHLAPPPSAIQHQDPVLPSTTKDTPIKETPKKESPSKVSRDLESEVSNRNPSKATEAEEIYQAYPRKIGKGAAIKAIQKALKSHSPETLLERTQSYAKAIVWQEPQFIPHPATWFNRGSYDDSPEEWEDRRGKATQSGGAVNLGRRNRFAGIHEDIDLPL